MAVTYTTAALVREQVHHISTDLIDGDIEEMINQAESKVDAAMKQSGINGTDKFTFSATKHGLIRMATTFLAAYMVLTSNTEEYTSSTHATLTADLLWSMWQDCLEDLRDVRVTDYLINL